MPTAPLAPATKTFMAELKTGGRFAVQGARRAPDPGPTA
jgi:hypothetical protein